jgi:uncharacterized protein (DUF1499 family)
MSTLTTIVLVLLAVAVLLLLAGQLGLLSGRAPQGLGVRDGKLKPPSRTPNSVCSQAAHWPDRLLDYAQIAPIALHGDGPATIGKLKSVIEAMPGARVVETKPDYLYAQFTTKLMKYVDDAEFWFDPAAQVVQVRSASRVGRKDFGVNRARIEAIRRRLAGAG